MEAVKSVFRVLIRKREPAFLVSGIMFGVGLSFAVLTADSRQIGGAVVAALGFGWAFILGEKPR